MVFHVLCLSNISVSVFCSVHSIDVTWCFIVFNFSVFGYDKHMIVWSRFCLLRFVYVYLFCLGLTDLLYYVLPKVHVIVKDIHTRVPDGADIA